MPLSHLDRHLLTFEIATWLFLSMCFIYLCLFLLSSLCFRNKSAVFCSMIHDKINIVHWTDSWSNREFFFSSIYFCGIKFVKIINWSMYCMDLTRNLWMKLGLRSARFCMESAPRSSTNRDNWPLCLFSFLRNVVHYEIASHQQRQQRLENGKSVGN